MGYKVYEGRGITVYYRQTNENEFLDDMTAEQKITRSIMDLRKIKPFYASMYEVIRREETSSVQTMSVGTDVLLYNEKFVDSLDYPEFIFAVLHELAHIMLMHCCRRESRDLKLWNYACDFYVNKLLYDELNLDDDGNAKVDGIGIKVIQGIMYCKAVDLDTDTVESMYETLEKQAEAQGWGDGLPGEYKFNILGDARARNGAGDFVVDRDGSDGDLGAGSGSGEIDKAESEKAVNNAIARVELSNTACGDSSDKMMAAVKKLLKSYINWKVLLKRYLIARQSRDSSFKRPDKRMSYQPAIYPGSESDEGLELQGLKVCIDTSGSVSDDDLSYFFGQVYSLVKQFKTKAELVYWDSEVQSCGNFENYADFQRVDCSGRGGTDPRCVFKYFDSKECKVKPIVTLMFTDGYFDLNRINTAKNRKNYKNTIWILTREAASGFTPPFGKVTLADFQNKRKP